MFYWGSATSSHQIEGDTNNQWTRWEKSKRRKRYLEKKNLVKKYGYENFISGRNSDHYHLYERDFDIARDLSHNAFRFSVEWSRVQPEKGIWDEAELLHYKKIIHALRERHLEPFLTLWHWTHPLWFEDMGAWSNKESEELFFQYAKKIVDMFHSDITFLITLNEPEIYASFSYLIGTWPPQKYNPFLFFRVIRTLLRVHKWIYAYVKEAYPHIQVGIAKNYAYFEARPNDFVNRSLRRIINWWWNDYVLRKTQGAEDFIGFNYYFHHYTRYGFLKHAGEKFSDVGWGLSSDGFYKALRETLKYKKPIYITEHGLADAKDEKRAWYIESCIKKMKQVMREGGDIRGYLHWSLLDNFEWAEGYAPRFGFVEVNYNTFERTIRPSAYALKKIIEESRNEVSLYKRAP